MCVQGCIHAIKTIIECLNIGKKQREEKDAKVEFKNSVIPVCWACASLSQLEISGSSNG